MPPESVSVVIEEVRVVVTLAVGVTVVPTAIEVAVIVPELVVSWMVADVAVLALAFSVIAPATVKVFPLSTSRTSPVPAAEKRTPPTVPLPVSSSEIPVFIWIVSPTAGRFVPPPVQPENVAVPVPLPPATPFHVPLVMVHVESSAICQSRVSWKTVAPEESINESGPIRKNSGLT